MKLTIAIPSLRPRINTLKALLGSVYLQIGEGNFGTVVEVLVYPDNRQLSIGAKRNWLLDNARGEFIAYVDDDDRIADKYIASILHVITSTPDLDCVGVSGIFHDINRKQKKKFIHSIEYDRYFEKNNVLYRCPNHINPIRTALARQCRFPEISMGEDTAWSLALRDAKLLRKEFFIADRDLYFYDFINKK